MPDNLSGPEDGLIEYAKDLTDGTRPNSSRVRRKFITIIVVLTAIVVLVVANT